MSDCIHVSSAVAGGLNAISEAYDLGDFNVWIDPHRAAFVLMLLKALPDREDWFPRGKWATCQNIEAQLTKLVRDLIEQEPTE